MAIVVNVTRHSKKLNEVKGVPPGTLPDCLEDEQFPENPIFGQAKFSMKNF